VRATEMVFGGKEVNFEILAKFLPVVDRSVTVVDGLVEAGLAGSKAEARQLIGSGAISVAGEKIGDDMTLSEQTVVKRGKNKFMVVR